MSLALDPELCEPSMIDPARPEGPDEVAALLLQGDLSAVFQPILWMREGTLLGYEGLIRGPQGSPLRAPDRLFEVARRRLAPQ